MKKNNNNVRFGTFDIAVVGVISAAIIVIHSLLCRYTPIDPIACGFLMIAVFAAAVCAFAVVKRNITDAKNSRPLPQTLNVLADSIVNLPAPAVICPENSDRIIWFNKCAATLFGRRQTDFSDIFATLEDFTGEVRLGAAGRRYKPESYISAGSDGRVYRVFIMNDVTEHDEMIKTLNGKECAVAYVSVDNLDELLNYEQEDYRSASGLTEKLLRAWANDAGGVLKEYHQDKYIFLFERSNIEKFMADGFDILDRIRDIRVGDTSIPVTVSIGICVGSGTLSERERAAQAALETALQRGGDQVVVKTDEGTELFGGRTKMQQKRTTVRARVIGSELISYMTKASNVIVMAHKYADFDAFGASVGIARLAMFCGIPVNIVSDLDDSDLDRCRGWLRDEPDYRGVFVRQEIAMDMIRPDTLLVIVDVNNRMQFESVEIADNCSNIVIIDHHRKTADDRLTPKISYIEPSASAASELVAEILEQVLPADILLPNEADLMLAGILLDTNQFKKNTGTRTFSAALYLRSRGADVGDAQEFFKTDLGDFQRELKFHSNVEIYRNIAAIAVPDGMCTLKDKVPAAKAADKLLSVEGVKASFAVVPIENSVHISARSAGTINVQLLLEKLRGGGHFDSAGTRLEGIGVDEAVRMLKDAIDGYLNENK